MKRCKDCANMPCTKEECDMENQSVCNDFESQITKLVKVDKLNYKFEEVK